MTEPMIPCSRCDHESVGGLAAFEHWRDNHKRRVGEELFNPAKGQRITAVGVDGSEYTGTVTDVQEDKETGEIRLTAQRWPDAPQWLGVLGESEGQDRADPDRQRGE